MYYHISISIFYSESYVFLIYIYFSQYLTVNSFPFCFSDCLLLSLFTFPWHYICYHFVHFIFTFYIHFSPVLYSLIPHFPCLHTCLTTFSSSSLHLSLIYSAITLIYQPYTSIVSYHYTPTCIHLNTLRTTCTPKIFPYSCTHTHLYSSLFNSLFLSLAVNYLTFHFIFQPPFLIHLPLHYLSFYFSSDKRIASRISIPIPFFSSDNPHIHICMLIKHCETNNLVKNIMYVYFRMKC